LTDLKPAAGAKIIFGDVDDTLATKLVSTLNSKDADAEERVHFVHCDTSNYANQLHLFQTAYNLYKRIDIVIANAAIVNHKDPFTAAHESDEAILSAPSLAEIDVNLKGLLYTTRLGLHYLRKNTTTTSPSGYKGDVVLVSSIAGFKEGAGHTTYTASKHGVIGVVRGLALEGEKEGIRVNTVCPWMTSRPPPLSPCRLVSWGLWLTLI
jgi:NAD(P)-dependent dehydrogenase (short-subunit alcohol dehydrogenase family)